MASTSFNNMYPLLKRGAAVDLSSYTSSSNAYTTPSDGYITVWSKTARLTDGSMAIGEAGGGGYITTRIHRGWKCWIVGTKGNADLFYFYPLNIQT